MTQPYGQQPAPGGLPSVSPDHGQGEPVVCPGGVMAAAVLTFVQAALTIISAGVFLVALVLGSTSNIYGMYFGPSTDEFWIVTLLGLAAGGLLIAGGVKALGGSDGRLFTRSIGLQLALCLYWLVRFPDLGGPRLWPILMAVMPIIAISLWSTSAAKQYVAAKNGSRH